MRYKINPGLIAVNWKLIEWADFSDLGPKSSRKFSYKVTKFNNWFLKKGVTPNETYKLGYTSKLRYTTAAKASFYLKQVLRSFYRVAMLKPD